jgi:hypothetical protein
MTTIKQIDKLAAEIETLETKLQHKRRQLAQKRAESQGFKWQEISDRILLLRDPERRNGWSYLTYVGFRTKAEAEKCLSYLVKAQAAGVIEGPRPTERVETGKWELKIRDLNPAALDAMIRKQAEATAAEANEAIKAA